MYTFLLHAHLRPKICPCISLLLQVLHMLISYELQVRRRLQTRLVYQHRQEELAVVKRHDNMPSLTLRNWHYAIIGILAFDGENIHAPNTLHSFASIKMLQKETRPQGYPLPLPFPSLKRRAEATHSHTYALPYTQSCPFPWQRILFLTNQARSDL